jgi:hypothetical protein
VRIRLLRPLVLVTLAVVGCGPSFQTLYEGNARFEHCYALEENPQVPLPEKAACWRYWSEHYTFGQTRDRIHYATARYVALSEAHDMPTDEALMMAAPGETPRRSTITAPAPTNAFAPPPKVLDPAGLSISHMNDPTGVPAIVDSGIPTMAVDGGVAPSTSTALPPVKPPAGPVTTGGLPSASCAETCGSAYRTCKGDACGDAGPTAKCDACTKTYRTCMRDCFK